MHFLAWLATVVPSASAGITVGHVVASLDAPAPIPFAAAVAVAILAACVIDNLIDALQAHRATMRG